MMKEVKMGSGVEISGEEERVNGLLYADDLILCGESEEYLRAGEGRFVELRRRKSLKVNAVKNKVMVIGREDGLEHVFEFKY